MKEPYFSEADWKREQQELERMEELEEEEERKKDYEPINNS
jgi:hypothetical protein